jgi:hypothetical protein
VTAAAVLCTIILTVVPIRRDGATVAMRIVWTPCPQVKVVPYTVPPIRLARNGPLDVCVARRR